MTFHPARFAFLVAASVALVTTSAAGQARSGGAPAPRFDWSAMDPSSFSGMPPMK